LLSSFDEVLEVSAVEQTDLVACPRFVVLFTTQDEEAGEDAANKRNLCMRTIGFRPRCEDTLPSINKGELKEAMQNVNVA
jgi:hypothetical protein